MLSKDEILRRTGNGLDVFKHYIPGQWRVGRNFYNPLYDDHKASCNVYFDRRSGVYRMKDFGNDAYSGDCFDIISKLTGLDCANSQDFISIMQTINHDLNLGLSDDGKTWFAVPELPKTVKPCEIKTQQPEQPQKKKNYSIVQQSFSAMDFAFWQQYGITSEILKTCKVFSLREFKGENNEGKPFTLFSSATEPMFGYVGNGLLYINPNFIAVMITCLN